MMKLLNRNMYVKELKGSLKSIRRKTCGNCKKSWIRLLVKEIEKCNDYEICMMYDYKNEFYDWCMNYTYRMKDKVCHMLIDGKLSIRDLVEEFVRYKELGL